MSNKIINSKQNFDLVIFENGEVRLSLNTDKKTIWATQEQISKLFGVEVPAISKHLNNIYNENELDRKSTLSILEIVQKEGNRDVKRQIEHYNLDLIIAVGYRVNSVKATQFRRWATGVLKNYLVSGYTLNKEILQNNPEKFKILLQKIAEIRNSEKTKNLLLPSDIKIILNSISYSALWQDIVEFEKLDERVAIVNCIFANLIGVNNGYIECCPSDNAPSLMESFTWWWVVRPDLGAAITINLHKNVAEAQKLREAIADYILGLQWRGYF